LKNEETKNAEFYTQQDKHADGTGIEPDLIPVIQAHMYTELKFKSWQLCN